MILIEVYDVPKVNDERSSALKKKCLVYWRGEVGHAVVQQVYGEISKRCLNK
jgi:hypothetical protein